MNGKLAPVHIKGVMAPELLEGTICSCSCRNQLFGRSEQFALYRAVKIPHSIGDQDVLSDYDGDCDDDDNDGELKEDYVSGSFTKSTYL